LKPKDSLSFTFDQLSIGPNGQIWGYGYKNSSPSEKVIWHSDGVKFNEDGKKYKAIFRKSTQQSSTGNKVNLVHVDIGFSGLVLGIDSEGDIYYLSNDRWCKIDSKIKFFFATSNPRGEIFALSNNNDETINYIYKKSGVKDDKWVPIPAPNHISQCCFDGIGIFYCVSDVERYDEYGCRVRIKHNFDDTDWDLIATVRFKHISVGPKLEVFGCGSPVTDFFQPDPHMIWHSSGIFNIYSQLDSNTNFQFDKCYVGTDGKVYGLTSEDHDLQFRNSATLGNWENVDICEEDVII